MFNVMNTISHIVNTSLRSRPGYEYPPQQWEYRNYYNQYDHDPYWGQRRGPGMIESNLIGNNLT